MKKAVATLALALALLGAMVAPASAGTRAYERGHTWYAKSFNLRLRLENQSYGRDRRFTCDIAIKGYRWNGNEWVWGTIAYRQIRKTVWPRHYLNTSTWLYWGSEDERRYQWYCNSYLI
jgi:hypothetical protein